MANKKKKSDSSSLIQSRTFTLELYPEWDNFMSILSYIYDFKYAYIVHDKDIKDEETGELKKEHAHVVIKYGGRRTLSSVKNEYSKLGVPKNLINTCNERAMLRYLIHKDNPEKYQYKQSEVITNMPSDFITALQDEITSDEAFRKLNELILKSEKPLSQAEMNLYALDNGLLKGLKAYGSQLNNARIEKNKYLQSLQDEEMIIDRTRAQIQKAIDTGLEKGEAKIRSITDEAKITGIKYFDYGGSEYALQIIGKSKPVKKESVFDEEIDLLKEARKK